MKDIRKIKNEEIIRFIEEAGEKKFKAKQIDEWLWKKGVHSFNEMLNLSLELRQKLTSNFLLEHLSISDKFESRDGTIKFLFSLPDKHFIEGVLIPADKRVTACISSQVGCPLNCSFCATGQSGFARNLHFTEIYDQFLLMNKESLLAYQREISNIVFMGMGEPLLNYDHVLQSIELLTSSRGQGWSPSRITLSTVGIVEKIRQLADDHVKVGLAVSLHVADPEKRLRLMPVTASNPLPELQKALQYYASETGNRVSIEYLLLDDINNSIPDADKLLRFCKLFPVKINLIEYNSTDARYRKSPPQKTSAFMEYLEQKNMIVTMRHSRGDDIAAACGQLAAKKVKKNIK